MDNKELYNIIRGVIVDTLSDFSGVYDLDTETGRCGLASECTAFLIKELKYKKIIEVSSE